MGKVDALRHVAGMYAWGALSNVAIAAWMFSPREMLQDEFFRVHRFALQKSHSHRKNLEKAMNHESAT